MLRHSHQPQGRSTEATRLSVQGTTTPRHRGWEKRQRRCLGHDRSYYNILVDAFEILKRGELQVIELTGRYDESVKCGSPVV
jgi:hypothetical protein